MSKLLRPRASDTIHMNSIINIFTGAILLSVAPAVAEDALPGAITELFDAYVSLPDTLVPVLQSATDKHAADKAAPRLREELKKLFAIRESLQKVRSLTPKQNEQVRKRYEKDMREQWGKVYTEMFRLQRNRCYGSADFAREYKTMCLMLNK